MDNKLIDEKLNEALALHDEGKSYTQIRAHFTPELDDDMISYIIRLVDEFAIEENRIREDLKRTKFKMKVGVIAFFLSCFLLYILYDNRALEGITVQWIYSVMMLVQYFPVAFSVYFLWKTHQEESRLKKIEPEIDDTKFRLKRRRKKE
jgi:hypothetical protein